MVSVEIRLQSDFVDYYDDYLREHEKQSQLQNQIQNRGRQNSYIYQRLQSNNQHRAMDLKFLRENGIPTFGLKPVSQFQLLDPFAKILVYTDPFKHGGQGKSVIDNIEAQSLYGNMPGRVWVDSSETDGYTLKYLQIGERRFKIFLRANTGKSSMSTRENTVEDIVELPKSYSTLAKHGIFSPIFSIDYIPTSNGIIATDFNQVENLSILGIDKVIPPNEIYTALAESFWHYY